MSFQHNPDYTEDLESVTESDTSDESRAKAIHIRSSKSTPDSRSPTISTASFGAMSSGMSSHVRGSVSKHSTIPQAERSRSSISKDALRLRVNRKTPHPSHLAKKYKNPEAGNALRSPLICKAPSTPQTTQSYTSSIPEDILTPSVKRMARSTSHIAKRILSPASKDRPKSAVKPKTAYPSQSASRPLAWPSKRKVYDPPVRKPAYSHYSQCTCDVEEDSDGEDKLTRAEFSGKAIYVLGYSGTQVISCAHLRDCVQFVVEYPVQYDPATIVTDFLRARGSHPRLPALNQYWNETLAMELQAIRILKRRLSKYFVPSFLRLCTAVRRLICAAW